MKRILKYLGIILGGLLIILLLSAAGLYVATRGDYQVPATVMDDPGLSRLVIDGYTFHGEIFGQSDNPVVIVLHGGPGGDYRSLLGLQALADEYFVVFYDQRGAGLSERVPAEQLTLASSLRPGRDRGALQPGAPRPPGRPLLGRHVGLRLPGLRSRECR